MRGISIHVGIPRLHGKMKSAGPKVNPLASPLDETDEFLIKLALAHSDIHEALWGLPRVEHEHGGYKIYPKSFWNPGQGTVYG